MREGWDIRGHGEESWERRHAFYPILLIVLALTAWTTFQSFALWRERVTLRTAKANQEMPVQSALKARIQLDSIAKEMTSLAAQGNAGARAIIEELRKRGVTINPDAPPPAAPQ